MGLDCKAEVIQSFGSMVALCHLSGEHSGKCIGYTAMTPWSTLAIVSLYMECKKHVLVSEAAHDS